jgi:hypothetical protein
LWLAAAKSVVAAVAAVPSPVIVVFACVPVWVERSRSWASVALAVAPVAMPSSFVFADDPAHHAATASNTRCGVKASRLVDVPACASAVVTVAADHSREFVSRASEVDTVFTFASVTICPSVTFSVVAPLVAGTMAVETADAAAGSSLIFGMTLSCGQFGTGFGRDYVVALCSQWLAWLRRYAAVI